MADDNGNVRGCFPNDDGFPVPARHGIKIILYCLVRKPFTFLEVAGCP